MIQLIHGDCLDEMKKLEADSVDLILTDPPYGLEFMGKDWDKGVPGVHFWVEMLRVLKPGGYLLSFSGTRTYHRMGTAIEDAGFEVRDMIEWVYGSGFPKSLNISKAIEATEKYGKSGTRTLRQVEQDGDGAGYELKGKNNGILGETRTYQRKEYTPTGTAKEWSGWGTTLKPAHEPICMARKPLAEKTVAENCLKYGTGGINIDGCRVEYQGDADVKSAQPGNMGKTSQKASWGTYGTTPATPNIQGRFPANLIHDGSEEVVECFPNESERFFKSIIYQAKASKSERNKGCEGLEEKDKNERKDGGKSLLEISGKTAKNNHPTVKPVALMEYLAKMCSTEGATILDPFMGSGTTGVACKNLNRNFIGIELDSGYYEIAKKRIEV